jgi:hypothetical protein
LVENSERNTPHGRLRRRWEDDIKTDLEETNCEIMDCIYRVSKVKNFPVPAKMESR